MLYSYLRVWHIFSAGQADSCFLAEKTVLKDKFTVVKHLAVLHIKVIGACMAEPRAGIVNMALSVLPVAGAMKMPQYHDLRLRVKLLGKTVGSPPAGQPAADDVQGTLRWPKTM